MAKSEETAPFCKILVIVTGLCSHQCANSSGNGPLPCPPPRLPGSCLLPLLRAGSALPSPPLISLFSPIGNVSSSKLVSGIFPTLSDVRLL